jgi:hypothetical protein
LECRSIKYRQKKSQSVPQTNSEDVNYNNKAQSPLVNLEKNDTNKRMNNIHDTDKFSDKKANNLNTPESNSESEVIETKWKWKWN